MVVLEAGRQAGTVADGGWCRWVGSCDGVIQIRQLEADKQELEDTVGQ